jgi:hypothetical protein
MAGQQRQHLPRRDRPLVGQAASGPGRWVEQLDHGVHGRVHDTGHGFDTLDIDLGRGGQQGVALDAPTHQRADHPLRGPSRGHRQGQRVAGREFLDLHRALRQAGEGEPRGAEDRRARAHPLLPEGDGAEDAGAEILHPLPPVERLGEGGKAEQGGEPRQVVEEGMRRDLRRSGQQRRRAGLPAEGGDPGGEQRAVREADPMRLHGLARLHPRPVEALPRRADQRREEVGAPRLGPPERGQQFADAVGGGGHVSLRAPR